MLDNWEKSDKNILTSSFTPESNCMVIPRSSYKAKKSCPFCQSYYLTDTHCEACGKSLIYDSVGGVFSEKSFFAIKERYIEDFDIAKRFYPVLESIYSQEAKKYCRSLKKRLIDLLDFFQFREVFYDENSIQERKIFYIECQLIIEELLEYDQDKDSLIDLIVAKSSGSLQIDLVHFSLSRAQSILIDKRNYWQKFGDLKIYHTVRIRSLITLILVAGSLIGASLYFKQIYFSS